MSETFAARLTAEVPSAIATIAVAGPNTLPAVLQFARIPSGEPVVGRIHYGLWQLAGNGPSEQVVLCRVAEDSLEIHSHGGNAICRGIINDLKNAGCSIVPAKRWRTLRAGMRNDQNPIAEAAAQDLLSATTDLAAGVLLDQLNGALEEKLRDILQLLASDDLLRSAQELDALLHWCRLGMHLSEPWRIVLAGPPNVGKSSLTNAIIGSQQSIVHHEPGTTRDWVEASCAIAGWPVCLSDTAGLRASEDVIEVAGIGRARQQVAEADLVLAVVDATVGWTPTHQDLCQRSLERGVPVVVAWNKADMEAGQTRPQPDGFELVETSAVQEAGIDRLLAVLSQRLVPEAPSVGTAVPFRREHVERIQAAREAVEKRQANKASGFLESLLVRLG